MRIWGGGSSPVTRCRQDRRVAFARRTTPRTARRRRQGRARVASPEHPGRCPGPALRVRAVAARASRSLAAACRSCAETCTKLSHIYCVSAANSCVLAHKLKVASGRMETTLSSPGGALTRLVILLTAVVSAAPAARADSEHERAATAWLTAGYERKAS